MASTQDTANEIDEVILVVLCATAGSMRQTLQATCNALTV